MGTRRKWIGVIVIVAMLLLGSAGPGYARQGGHGAEAMEAGGMGAEATGGVAWGPWG